ncbi:uncharacterized protein V1518DRAFT_415534 [Limtongia smithiae]|uniref:uncharacterized protein n=1 Tax=Limtongia smithiae TaxID=1125753 RepID=UPI0034CDECA2
MTVMVRILSVPGQNLLLLRSPLRDFTMAKKKTRQTGSQLPCAFFQQGSCLKGNKCPFSHNIVGSDNTSASASNANTHNTNNNTNNNRQSQGRFSNTLNVNASNANANASAGPNDEVSDADRSEMVDMLQHPPVYVYSSYGVTKGARRGIINDRDISPEELRLRYYEAKQRSETEAYEAIEDAADADMHELYNFILSDVDKALRYVTIARQRPDSEVKEYIPLQQMKNSDASPGLLSIRYLKGEDGVYPHLCRLLENQIRAKQSSQQNGGADSVFGARLGVPSSLAATSARAQQEPQPRGFAHSAFGTSLQPLQSPAFGQSAFGAAPGVPTPASAFDPSAFGAAKPPAPAFGQSAFGTTPASAPSTTFGQSSFTAAPPPAFGQSTFGAPKLAFGQSTFGSTTAPAPAPAPANATPGYSISTSLAPGQHPTFGVSTFGAASNSQLSAFGTSQPLAAAPAAPSQSSGFAAFANKSSPFAVTMNGSKPPIADFSDFAKSAAKAKLDVSPFTSLQAQPQSQTQPAVAQSVATKKPIFGQSAFESAAATAAANSVFGAFSNNNSSNSVSPFAAFAQISATVGATTTGMGGLSVTSVKPAPESVKPTPQLAQQSASQRAAENKKIGGRYTTKATKRFPVEAAPAIQVGSIESVSFFKDLPVRPLSLVEQMDLFFQQPGSNRVPLKPEQANPRSGHKVFLQSSWPTYLPEVADLTEAERRAFDSPGQFVLGQVPEIEPPLQYL